MPREYTVAGAVVVVALALALLTRRGTGDIPDDPDAVFVYSVDGTQEHITPEERGVPKGQELLYECAVLGRVAITDPVARREVVAAVKRDIKTGHPTPSKCLRFRHVIRVVKGRTTTDVIICFECHNYQLHRDGGPHVGLTPPIGEGSKDMLNKILTDAGIPLAP
jgi:hypothetical protein